MITNSSNERQNNVRNDTENKMVHDSRKNIHGSNTCKNKYSHEDNKNNKNNKKKRQRK